METFINGDMRYRVYNKCKYDIGVKLANDTEQNIKPDSFKILTVNDILYIESMCTANKFFASRMLVAVNDNGEEVDISNIGITHDEGDMMHYSDAEIEEHLKLPFKKFEAWLNTIDDEAELYAIRQIAEQHDELPANKAKLLANKGDIADVMN